MFSGGRHRFARIPPVHQGMQQDHRRGRWVGDKGPPTPWPVGWAPDDVHCTCHAAQHHPSHPPLSVPCSSTQRIKQESWDTLGDCNCQHCLSSGWRQAASLGIDETFSKWAIGQHSYFDFGNQWGAQPGLEGQMGFHGCCHHHHMDGMHPGITHPDAAGRMPMHNPFAGKGFRPCQALFPGCIQTPDSLTLPKNGLPTPHVMGHSPGFNPLYQLRSHRGPRPPPHPPPRPAPAPEGSGFQRPLRNGQMLAASHPELVLRPPEKRSVCTPQAAITKQHKPDACDAPLAVQRPKTAEEQEEVRRWLEDRRQNYPSQENIQRKQKEREQRRKRGESDPVAQRQITLKDIIDKQRTLGVDKAAGTSLMFIGGPGRGMRGRGRGFGRMWQRGRGRFILGKRRLEGLEGQNALSGDEGLLSSTRNASRHFVQHRKLQTGPQGREPSLLEKLLYKEMKRDNSYILQCLRFLVENNFLQDLGTVPLVFPEDAAEKEEHTDLREQLPKLPPVEGTSGGSELSNSESEEGELLGSCNPRISASILKSTKHPLDYASVAVEMEMPSIANSNAEVTKNDKGVDNMQEDGGGNEDSCIEDGDADGESNKRSDDDNGDVESGEICDRFEISSSEKNSMALKNAPRLVARS